MKHILILLIPLLLIHPIHAEYREWTNRSGEAAIMKLIRPEVVNGELVGKFMLRNGRISTVKHSDLSDQDQARLDGWVPVMSGLPSVFDETLWRNLVCLEGDRFQKAFLSRKPEKYYIFYYTASWCGPCRKFTPTLVDWYERNINGNFELFLISSDRNIEAMESYAMKNRMPWPHLRFDEVSAFKKKFRANHGVQGIPSLIVCDREGNVLGNFRSRLDRLSAMVK